ncbi:MULTISPECIES: dihydropteroate synthase [Campylobacter]|uniref:dihydropteroate synthase n=1 Tax=Campylobacter TaxID=194 RepID=UPI000A3401D3|nr:MULTISPECIES: dihydropteroate synthase [unclassified Campylobacter]MCR8695724.1 dihydropteroate synthase [Campylobacter sp. RM19073]
MRAYKLNIDSDFDQICNFIAPHKSGAKIMRKKANLNFILIKDIKAVAVNILKQDALSIGAELVSSHGAIFGGEKLENALLIINDKQAQILAKKELSQDFGLKKLGYFLSNSFQKPKKCEIMAVLNFNNDSFNPASRVGADEAVLRMESLIDLGVDYIDIGMVSSRPGSEYIGAKAEFERVKPVVDLIYTNKLYEKVEFSLDSFDPFCLEYALNHGFGFVNDISADTNLAFLAGKYGAKYCLMHKNGDTKTMQINVKNSDILEIISEFFAQKLEKIKESKAKQIYLDVGIGFGKTARDNMALIKHLEHFLSFGYPLLVGASRKSMIDYYNPSSVDERLAGSLYLHQKAIENGASIIRTHDPKEHIQMLNLHNAYKDLEIV